MTYINHSDCVFTFSPKDIGKIYSTENVEEPIFFARTHSYNRLAFANQGQAI